MPPPIYTPSNDLNREAWLTKSVGLMRTRLFAEHGFKVPDKVRVSVGFPKGGRGLIGQCWQPGASADGTAEVFVHPEIEDPIRVLDIVSHELVHTINHAADQSGHGKPFRVIAEAIGLEGKMTATVASSGLVAVLKDYAGILGPYPHRSLIPGTGGPKKQGTRMLALICPRCEYKVRTTQKWVDVGMPACPCGEEMILEDAKEPEEE